MGSSEKKQLFQPLDSSARTSGRVAAAIRKVILGGQLGAGETLPPERALAERFRVTRNTVREALRTLEQLRLVSIRQGSGIRVRDYLTHAGLEVVVDLLDSDGAADQALMAELAEARQVIGRAMDHHAIHNFSSAVLPQMIAAVDQMEAEAARAEPDDRRLQELDFEVHNLLVRGSGNRALLLLHNSVRHIYRRVAPLFAPLVADPAPVIKLHRQLLAALEAGDQSRAKAVITKKYEAGLRALSGANARMPGCQDAKTPK